MNVNNKVVIVTGASRGIGMATARLLTQQGAKVALVARSKIRLNRLAAELDGSLVVVCDMSDSRQISAMINTVHQHYGRIDLLVNNAGRGYDATVEEIDLQTLNDIIALDLMGPLQAMQEVIPIMQSQGQGMIINVSSGTALMHLPNMGGYAAIKAALSHLSLTAREELKHQKVSVSVVYPYMTDTDFERNTIKGKVDQSLFNGNGSGWHDPDTAEYVAALILRAIKTGAAEVFAHDWMYA